MFLGKTRRASGPNAENHRRVTGSAFGVLLASGLLVENRRSLNFADKSWFCDIYIYIFLYYMILYYIILCYIILYYIIFYYIIVCYIIYVYIFYIYIECVHIFFSWANYALRIHWHPRLPEPNGTGALGFGGSMDDNMSWHVQLVQSAVWKNLEACTIRILQFQYHFSMHRNGKEKHCDCHKLRAQTPILRKHIWFFLKCWKLGEISEYGTSKSTPIRNLVWRLSILSA